ncbi:carbohydrate ABC transporter permease [Paenibacillus sp. MCAF20]
MKTESKGLEVFSNVIMGLFAAFCLIPFVLLISASLTDQNAILTKGYSFIPQDFSAAAYEYLIHRGSDIARAYTQLFDLKNTIWALIIPGMLTNGFFVMMTRTFFQTTIPPALIESAQIDGASELRTLWSVVIPLSTPIMATMGLFQSIMYWNDWQLGMMYVTDPKLFSIQNLLNRIMQDIDFINANLGSNAGAALEQMPSDAVKMAIAVIGVLPILVAYPFFQKYFIKGIMIGAVKG